MECAVLKNNNKVNASVYTVKLKKWNVVTLVEVPIGSPCFLLPSYRFKNLCYSIVFLYNCTTYAYNSDLFCFAFAEVYEHGVMYT